MVFEIFDIKSCEDRHFENLKKKYKFVHFEKCKNSRFSSTMVNGYINNLYIKF